MGVKMPVTMTDIAKRCGVSQTLVSLVLNGRDKKVGVSPKTHDMILRAAQALGYCRNEIAVSIAKRQSKVLAFVAGNMGSVEYTGRIQNGIFAEANAHGYAVNVFHLDGESSVEIANKIIGWMMAGVIFHVSDLKYASEICEILQKHDIPYGFTNLSNPDGIGVTTDDYAGAKKAVKHLVESGCKKILFLTYSANESEYLVKRLAGYQDGMKEYLPDEIPDMVTMGDVMDISSVDFIRKILRSRQPDGIFCVGDALAMRAEAAILGMQLRIPEDIAIVGYGNSDMGQFAPVPLTTIEQDYERMGKLAVQGVLNAAKTIKNNQYLPVKLLIRESTKK